jgi:hypothetical protein
LDTPPPSVKPATDDFVPPVNKTTVQTSAGKTAAAPKGFNYKSPNISFEDGK